MFLESEFFHNADFRTGARNSSDTIFCCGLAAIQNLKNPKRRVSELRNSVKKSLNIYDKHDMKT